MCEQPNVIDAVVTDRKEPGTGVIIITLARPDGGLLPPFTAGAHIALHLPGGLLRHYSLCGDPARRRQYKLAVLVTRHSTGGGQIIRDRLLPGVRLQMGEPRNHFPLLERPGRTLLLAGGIGITPLLLMALTLKRQGRPYRLHYFGRADTLRSFADEPDYAEIMEDILVADDGPAAIATADPAADAGMVSGGRQAALAELLQDWRRDGRFELYYCGSTEFMQAIAEQCLALGLPAEDCHYESFAPPKPAGEKAFDVKIHGSGDIIPVGPDQTIAAALSQAGINVEISCGLGLCGTCLAGVKDGIPDHRDDYLSASEKAANDRILLCCSRAHSATLVIDL